MDLGVNERGKKLSASSSNLKKTGRRGKGGDNERRSPVGLGNKGSAVTGKWGGAKGTRVAWRRKRSGASIATSAD